MPFRKLLIGALAMTVLATVIACSDDDAATTTSSSGAATATRVVTASPTRAPSPTLIGPVPDPALETYTSSAHQFSIQHPADWTATAGDDDDTLTPPSSPDTMVLVEFGPMPDGDASDPGLQRTAKDAARGHYGAQAQIVGVYNLGEREALVLEWGTLPGDNGEYGLQAWVPNGDQSWYITMLTPVQNRTQYETIFRQMLDSFRSEG